MWTFLGILPGWQLRGWPSFDPDTFDLKSHTFDAYGWPQTSTHQVSLSQTRSLQFHYSSHVAKSRLLNAAFVLSKRCGPYSTSSVSDTLYDVFKHAFVPEMAMFIARNLKTTAQKHWNNTGGWGIESPEYIRRSSSKVPIVIDEYLESSEPFTHR